MYGPTVGFTHTSFQADDNFADRVLACIAACASQECLKPGFTGGITCSSDLGLL